MAKPPLGLSLLLAIAFSAAIPAIAQQLSKGPSPASPPSRDARAHGLLAAEMQRYAPDRVLVRFRPAATREQRQQLHAAVGAKKTKKMHIVEGLEIVYLATGVRVTDALRQYRRSPNVLYAEPDYRVNALITPNDPAFGMQWALHNTGGNGGTPDADIDAPEAWEFTTGSAGVAVGIIDTGVDYTHPDLAANIWSNPLDCNANGVDDDGNGYVDDCHGIDTFNGDSNPMDDNGHGTHLAGIIGAAGNNAVGVVGVNWQVRMVACKFLDSYGVGYDSGAIACLEYLKTLHDAGVNLVASNNSWGGSPYSQALYDAIDGHRKAGMLFVAAAGNYLCSLDIWNLYPVNFNLPNLIAVAATTRSDSLAWFSDFGVQSVHLGAPGEEIYSTLWPGNEWYPGQYYGELSGTSMAAPHVAGVAALLKSQDSSRDWRAIKNLILAGGDTIPALANTITGKRLNAYGAMTCSNSELLRRLEPEGEMSSAAVGAVFEIQELHISCAWPAGDLVATVEPEGTMVTLSDDGTGGDQQAGDGIYTGQWVPSSTGIYTLTLAGGDSVVVHVLEPYNYAAAPYEYREVGDENNIGWGDYVDWLDTPFPVRFGGSTFSRMAVSDFGTIGFTDTFADSYWAPLPAHGTSTMVAPSWTLLWVLGNIFWDVLGTPPNRELVVEWRGVAAICDYPATITFEAVFFENSSDVLFNYKDMVVGADDWNGDCSFADNGALATSGIQVARNVATQYSYNEPVLQSQTAILWTIGAPTPTLSEISPFYALVGDPGLELDVFGKNFLATSAIRWNGSARPTTFQDSSHLHASIPASDLAKAGEIEITVATPGAGTSAALILTIFASAPVPVLSGVTPTETGGGSSTTLYLTGSGFISSSTARWDGVKMNTHVSDSKNMSAVMPGSATIGPHQITVYTPPPGGGVSAALTVRVTSFEVAASPLTATVRPSQSATFTVTVTPEGGAFDKRVFFGCPGLAAELTCSFTPPNGAPNSLPLNTTLTLTQYSQSASAVQRHSTMYLAWATASLLLGGVLILPKRGWRRPVMLLVLMGSLALYSCGGGNENRGGGGEKTYVITVEASSGTLTKRVQISLSVQP